MRSLQIHPRKFPGHQRFRICIGFRLVFRFVQAHLEHAQDAEIVEHRKSASEEPQGEGFHTVRDVLIGYRVGQ